MSVENKIAPEDVKIVSETKTLYRVEGDNYYFLSEYSARQKGSNALKCSCGNYVDKNGILPCKDCLAKKKKEEHLAKLAKAPFWNGEYPIILGDNFFENEDFLLDYFYENKTDISSIDDFYECSPVLVGEVFKKERLIEMVEDNIGCEYDEVTCPKNIESVIDSFLSQINEIKEPLSWRCGKLVKLTDEQIQDFNKSLSD